MRSEIAVVGANGFIGRRVSESLGERTGITVAQHVRRHPDESPTGFDLREPSSVLATLGRPLTVVHAASYVGSDVSTALEVNVIGTQNLLAAARTAQVHRFVYVSTAAVYGRGPFHERNERSLAIAPASVLSQTRAQAEQLVLDAGGIVVRPHLVVGAGDKWVLPTIARLIKALGSHIDEGIALHSTIHVRELGEVVAWLATHPDIAPGAYNASTKVPTSARVLTKWAETADPSVSPAGSLSLSSAQSSLDENAFLRNAVNLLGVHHTFDISKLLASGYEPPESETGLDRGDLAWYERSLAH
ncbi:hypothetical protein C5B85_08940 [Pseudoclavibacter sp. AY1F1]|uniref:NAD-dependent epimerase/dehydratase family protein n=1 Tax=Pseudoclavibacter sp. AY1F1 TaxID=2080583 RepID=UPI000CE769AD|nr:NAD(P)-dependent oxidoreductase [Pseudoclavibacter sp. AY1F1]PPF44855.1 hypothetical protein C5B85_08940 [Pseudoclavibacter sp. AY1F1]